MAKLSADIVTRVIDISHIARPFRLVRMANYFMVIACGTWLIGQVANAATVTVGWWPYVAALWVVLAINVLAGLRTAGRINATLRRWMLLATPALAVGCGAAALNLYFTMPADIDPVSNPVGSEHFVACVFASLGAIFGVFALFSTLRLDRARIPELGLSGRELLDRVRAAAVASNARARAKPSSFAKAMLYGAASAVVLAGLHWIPTAIWQPYSPILSFLPLLGWGLIFRARIFLQPDAPSLLKVDKRPNILFLRSFADDKRTHFLQSELSVIDFDIQTRLAAHFRPFGPFVAIRSPKDLTPRLGAPSAVLDNDKWQVVVREWMDNAQTIVWQAGRTSWVTWELKQILKRGHAKKLIVLMPQTKSWWPGWRRKDCAARLAKVSRLLTATPCRRGLSGITRPQDVRAVVLDAHGCVTIITSRPRNRDAYHFAAIVAHHLMLDANPPHIPG